MLRVAKPTGTPFPDCSWTLPLLPSRVVAVSLSLATTPDWPSVTPDAE